MAHTGKRGRYRFLRGVIFRSGCGWQRAHRLGSLHYGGDVPELQRLIQAPTDDALAVRSEGNTVNAIFVSSQLLQKLSRVDIPDSNHLVQAPSDDHGSISRDSDRGDTTLFALCVAVANHNDLT